MSIKLKGINELVAKLGVLESAKYLREPLRLAGMKVRNVLKKYPARSSANVPKAYPGRWYTRGFGPRWALKGGGAGGSRTSEFLGRRWAVRAGALRVIIENDASYAEVVHSAEKQATFHKQRGWVTDQTALDRTEAGIIADIESEIEKVI